MCHIHRCHLRSHSCFHSSLQTSSICKMKSNQVPASVVSIPNEGGPNVQHTFAPVTAPGRICWQVCVRLWSTVHTAGCLAVLRTFRWFSTITHGRCFLTNPWCAGYYTTIACLSGPWPYSRGLGLTAQSRGLADDASCPLELHQGPWATHSSTITLLGWSCSHTALGPSQHKLVPANRAATVSSLQRPLVKAGGRMRGTLASLKSGAFHEGNLNLMSILHSLWKCHSGPSAPHMATAPYKAGENSVVLQFLLMLAGHLLWG